MPEPDVPGSHWVATSDHPAYSVSHTWRSNDDRASYFAFDTPHRPSRYVSDAEIFNDLNIAGFVGLL